MSFFIFQLSGYAFAGRPEKGRWKGAGTENGQAECRQGLDNGGGGVEAETRLNRVIRQVQ